MSLTDLFHFGPDLAALALVGWISKYHFDEVGKKIKEFEGRLASLEKISSNLELLNYRLISLEETLKKITKVIVQME
jgi:hypothetical protein